MPTDTFGIAANGNDGIVWRSGPAYPPAGAAQNDTTDISITADRGYIGGQYFVQNGKLKWDTSSLPDGATITAATLRIVPVYVVNTNSLSLTMDWYVFDGSSSDFSHNALTTAHSGTALSAVTSLNTANDFALTNLSNISKTGTTGIRLHISQRASDAAPTGDNGLSFASREDTTYTEPQLIVTYTLVSAQDLIGQVGI